MEFTHILEDYAVIIIIALIAIIGIIVLGLILVKIKSNKKNVISNDDILAILGKNNILSIDFKRHKIQVQLKDSTTVNFEALKALGAVGINVVGDQVKFYFENHNESIYQELKSKVK